MEEGGWGWGMPGLVLGGRGGEVPVPANRALPGSNANAHTQKKTNETRKDKGLVPKWLENMVTERGRRDLWHAISYVLQISVGIIVSMSISVIGSISITA